VKLPSAVGGAVGTIAVATMLLAGCGDRQPTSSTVPLPAGQAEPFVCRGVGGGEVLLRGSSSDPRLTWETALDGTGRQEIVWPPGYRARFVPDLEVLDPNGHVIARDGDRIPGGGCAAGRSGDPTGIVQVIPKEWPG
jgi:hypothetical protein